MKTDTLIIGAGITGLSAAYHLKKLKKDFLTVERAAGPGGYCASVSHKGFTFDYSGHVAHTKQAYTRELLKKLLGKNAAAVKRKAWIFLRDTWVPFPFQTNLSYLKPEIVEECMTAFLSAAKNKKAAPENFERWALSSYGAGICKYFMLPYNKKLWRMEMKDLTTSWCASFVPGAGTEDIVKGAYFKTKADYGYNAFFIYPREGGIGALAKAFAENIDVKYNTEIISVDARKKIARTKNGGVIEFKNIISTAPLKTFVRTCKGLDKNIYDAAKKLKHNKVYVLNLGVDRVIENISWVYFPEEKFKFYRAGVQTQFSPLCAPAGQSAVYVEVSAPQNAKKPDFKTLEKEIISGLTRAGMLKKEDKITAELWLEINPAYVSYDKEREVAVPLILNALKEKNIYGAGRYGAWEYSFIERNILEGRSLAKAVSL